MKLHLDYLEGKVEELENASLKYSQDKKSLTKKLKDLEDKLLKMQTKYEEADKHAKLDESRHREAIEKLEKELEAYR